MAALSRLWVISTSYTERKSLDNPFKFEIIEYN